MRGTVLRTRLRGRRGAGLGVVELARLRLDALDGRDRKLAWGSRFHGGDRRRAWGSRFHGSDRKLAWGSRLLRRELLLA